MSADGHCTMGRVIQNVRDLFCMVGRQAEWINSKPGEVIPAPLLQSSRKGKGGPCCIMLEPCFLIRDPTLLFISSVT